MASYDKDDPQSIQRMFSSIAKRYDMTNSIMSLQMHRWWNSQLIHQVTDAHNPDSILDLCCGTGEIALTYLRKSKHPRKAYLLDFCDEMLECAKIKAGEWNLHKHDISFIQADAQAIPLADENVTCATIAYGIRNVKKPEECIKEVYRVLKPGGGFAILELTEPKNVILKYGHKIYLKTMLPLLGRCLASNQEAYEYLCNSISAFTKPEELEQMLREQGFVNTVRKPLVGGIATIIYGKKPVLSTAG